jgi:hypothetical protein
MCFYYSDYVCSGVFLVALVLSACALYAYRVNFKRPDDDPKKKNYHPLAIFLAPITFPLFAVFYIALFLLKVIVYGTFTVLFLAAMIFIRKPFLLEWLKKNARTIGDLLLQANTFLIRVFLRPWAGSGGAT